MRNRCTNPIVDRYPNYGGRGITICERWSKFENFYADMGEIPSKKHSIGRKDNDGNYEPNNCRWETDEQQNYNKSSTVYIELNGAKQALGIVAKESLIRRDTLYQRARVGMTADRLLSRSNLTIRPITVGGVTKLTTEWMSDANIPISSFYHFKRSGMSNEQIVLKYLCK